MPSRRHTALAAHHRGLRHLLVLLAPEGRTARILADQIPSLPPLDTTLHRQARVRLQVCLDITVQADQLKQKLALLERTQTQVHLLVAQAVLGTHTRGVMPRLPAKTAPKGINLRLITPNAIYCLQACLLDSQQDSLLDQPNKLRSIQPINIQGSLLAILRVSQRCSEVTDSIIGQ